MGNSWLRRLSPAPENGSHAVVCFPHAGGSAISYGPLVKRLRSEYDVLAVQYPGRQDRRREPLVDTISGLVDGLFTELTETLADASSFSLFGHSMGSAVAFETCRRLERETDARPALLFASGRRAPSQQGTEVMHTLSDRELADHLLNYGGTPAALLEDPEMRDMILTVTRNDYRAIETYACAPGATVACPIVALAGDRDADASLADLEVWRSHTTGSFSARTFPGGHFFLDANGDAVARLISEHSSRALSS
ncbi:thioesterase II family protein [Nocardia sp. AB354]|uniref:thioesterase II family protein n=1 Tax=Nocardia sp. AB354 TaxID=3413283 RepID=UPI003C1E7221